MAKNTSIIEINGNKYDAVTGQVIGAVKRVADQVKPAAGAIDGFVRKPVSAVAAKAPAAGRRVQNIARQPQKASTLVRSAVSRPVNAANASGVIKGRSAQPKPGQVLRSKTVSKSAKVKRFGSSKRAIEGQVLPPTAAMSRGSAAASAQTMSTLVGTISNSRLERLLDDALLRADSHRDMLRRQLAGNSPWARFKLMPKWFSIGATLLAVLLLGGFFAWQNIPQVSTRMASSKSHVSAAVPSYTPAGYKFASPASNTAKTVTIQYQAGNDTEQKYSISQQNSNWDSSTLASSVTAKSDQVQTSQVNGTTVYIYGSENNATWLDHGVLHTLNDQAGLSSDQILKIASSMQ